MSTSRRSTRATSRAASSRGASPAIDEQDIPATPSGRRTTRRATSSTPLPQVGLRTSNSYGTNQIAHSASMRAPSTSDQISSVLGVVLEGPEGRSEDDAYSSRAGPSARGGRAARRVASSVGSANNVDRSYNLEKNIFNTADVESSVLSEDSGVPEHPRNYGRPHESVAMQKQREIVAEVAHNTQVARVEEYTAKYNKSQKIFKWFILAIVVVSALIPLTLLASTTIPVVHTYLPNSDPGEYLKGKHVADLRNRMKVVETNIAQIKKTTDMDAAAVRKLEYLLPGSIVCKKDENGEYQIPDDFWHAISAKIRKDDTLFEKELSDQGITSVTKSKENPKGGLTKREVTNIVEKAIGESEKVWTKFLTNNKEKIVQWRNDDYQVHINKAMKTYMETHDILDRDQFIELIQKNWLDTQKEIQHYLDPVTAKMDEFLRKLLQVDQKTLNRDKVAKIAADIARKMIANAQLSAQSKANIHTNANEALRRVNHFSRGTGAVVDPSMTSPNYVFPSMQLGLVSRGLAWLGGRPIPLPKPPGIALEKWEEHGDCWCSPSKGPDGFGPSIAVMLGNNIQPDQVIIEHIAASAALEPGAAPKDMELLALIEDRQTYEALRQKSSLFFDPPSDSRDGAGWVRLGTWTYDAASPQTTQSFQMQIDLRDTVGASFTNKIIVRAKNNWGSKKVAYTCLYRIRVNGDIIN